MTATSSSEKYLVPALKECQDNPHLWDQLVLAEMVIPSSVIKRLPSLVQQLDIIEPLLVPDPRGGDRILFRVRTYSDGISIKQAYDQCETEGLLVCIRNVSCAWSTNMSAIPLCATIDLQQCGKKHSNPEKGGIFLGLLGEMETITNCTILLSIVVKERRLRPTCLPGSINDSRLLGAFCDVTLCVGGKNFPAHKVILSATSDVFKTMLMADFKEKTAARINIAGTSAVAFAKLLDFIYQDMVPDWEDYELELLQLADMYQVYRLKRLSEERIWELRGPESVAILLQLSRHSHSHHHHILSPSLHTRLCRQVARMVTTFEAFKFPCDHCDVLSLLRNDSPYTAGVIDGLVDAGGILSPIVYKCVGLTPAQDEQSRNKH